MARGTTLAILINDLRSEIGHSLQPSLGKSTRDVLVNILQRTQRRLWEDYGWPFLRVTRDIDISINQRYYDLPSDMTFERIKNLNGLIAETDKADLDDQLIVLYASAEMLARQKQADAQNKLAQAQAHYARLKARLSKTETFVLGGGEPEGLYRPKSPPLIATTGN